MLKSKIILMLCVVVLSLSNAGCYVYYEQSFKGTILDIDTKQPIEGAVVVAQYNKQTWFFAPSSMDSILDVRERLTDKEGKFHILPYVTLFTPFSWKTPTRFIIFKAGYASVASIEDPFSGIEMTEELKECTWRAETSSKCNFRRGIVEIPKVSSYREKLNATRGAVITGYGRRLPILYDAINKECKQLNISGYN